MRINESCAKCLYDRQVRMTDNAEYLAEIRTLLDSRDEDDSGPYLVFKFNKVYEKYFGEKASYKEIKKKDNDLVLSMEASIKEKIEASEDPLKTSLMYARIGNYIDYAALNNVDHKVFLSLFDNPKLSDKDEETYESFIKQCEKAKRFLLITDNCGEIVLDKLFLEQLSKRFPEIEINTLVRGAEALNDATKEDAEYVGLDKISKIYTNGNPITGTVYKMLPEEVKALIDSVDVIFSKGQGNYESMSNQGRHVFYSFLCKCDLFINRFNVPKLTGMFVEEGN